MNKTAMHPFGMMIEFNETEHTYVLCGPEAGYMAGKHLQSVTTFIGSYFPKFDTEKMAVKCAGKKPKYTGMTAEDIKEAWADEAHRGQTEGTNTHAYAECLLNGWFDRLPVPRSEREAMLFKQVARSVISLEERFQFVSSEEIIFSPKLGIAGTMDLLMLDGESGDLIILDWKQNKEISMSNRWENGYPPVDHVEASDYAKYSLQLNLYEKILREEKYYQSLGYRGVRKALIHLRTEDYSVIKVGDECQADLDAMLNFIPF